MRKMYAGMAVSLWTVVVNGLDYLAKGGHPTMSQIVATVIAAMLDVTLLFRAGMVTEKTIKVVGWTATIIVFGLFFLSLILHGALLQFWVPTVAGIVLGLLGSGIYIWEVGYRRPCQR